MLVPASLLQSVDCSTEWKNSIFHCTIGCNKYKSSLASGASPQTPPGGLFLPPRPPPPAWIHAAHRHGMVSPRKVWFQRPCSSLVLVPEEVVEPASGRYIHRGHASLSGGTALASVRSDRMAMAMSSCNARDGRVQAVLDMRGPDEPLASQQACEAAGGRCLVLVESKLRCFTASRKCMVAQLFHVHVSIVLSPPCASILTQRAHRSRGLPLLLLAQRPCSPVVAFDCSGHTAALFSSVS